MSLASNSLAWECRTDGDDTSGGGFDTSYVGGTDRSQAAAAHVTFDGATVFAQTTSLLAGDILIITGYTVIAGDVGNIVNITGGTNFTPGRYLIIAVDTGAGTWQVDRIACTAAGLLMTGAMGGALATPGYFFNTNFFEAGNVLWVRGGTYSEAALIVVGPNVPSDSQNGYLFQGYGTVRGDGGRPVLQLSAPSGGQFFIRFNYAVYHFRNFVIDANSNANRALYVTDIGQYQLSDLEVKNAVKWGVYSDLGPASLYRVEVHDCGDTAETDDTGPVAGGYNLFGANGPAYLQDCQAHDNTGAGFFLDGIVSLVRCLSYANAGNGLYNTNGAGSQVTIENCDSYGNTRNGLLLKSIDLPNALNGSFLRNNLFTGNTRYGVDAVADDTTGHVAAIRMHHNGFWGNTIAARRHVPAGAGDVTLTGDPFTNAAGGDFTLNNTAGAGAAAKAVGDPLYLDLGALQSAPAGGGGGTTFISIINE